LPPERRDWILVKKGASHLTITPHLKNVELTKERERRRRTLEKEREAASATDKLREIQFVAPHFPGPVAGTSSTQISEAEKDMWEDYRINGADFKAGEDVEQPEVREQQLRKEAEIFGLWNPEATAKKLGFGVENPDGEDEEDDWLAEIIRNVGESVAFRRLEVEVWCKSRWFVSIT
jgi:hypothetical protein